jgi:hypothetical protein
VHAIDLSQGPLDVAALRAPATILLRALDVEPDALAHALTRLREVRGLKTLHLHSRLRSLPPALGDLRQLQQLEIVDDQLPGLPAAIARLTRLRGLRLELLRLASLPRSLAALTRLRTLYIDSHHLVGLPAELAALPGLRSLTLLLRHMYVHDWERPAHFPPRFEQPPEALFRLLSGLPRLSSLTLGEPGSVGWPMKVLVRLPDEFAGLQALEELNLTDTVCRMPLPRGVVMPALRRLRVFSSYLDASPEELRAMFPNAVFGRPILDHKGRMLGAEDGVEYRWSPAL